MSLTLTTEPAWPFMNWRANKFLEVVARLKPEIKRSVAQAQLTSILRRGEGEPSDVQVELTLKDYIVGPVSRQLTIVMAAVALVLLVTCMNTAALLLSRTVKRSPELAVRLRSGSEPGTNSPAAVCGRKTVAERGRRSVGAGLGVYVDWPLERNSGLTLPRLDGLHLNLPAVCLSVGLAALTGMYSPFYPPAYFPS